MTSMQRPLHSGFDAASTARDVLADLDLRGKTAIVTGGHSGLGVETTRALALAGANVVVGARNPDAAREATHGMASVAIAVLDLADPASVAAFVAQFVDARRDVHIVINSAGIMACPETRVGNGLEAQIAVNHLGHYALVNRLWPALAHGHGARVVAVSSLGHRLSPIRWDDIQFARGYDKWLAYGQSKTANALFAVQLDALGAPFGVRAYSLHPGKIATPLQRHLTREEMTAQGWVDENGAPVDPTFKMPHRVRRRRNGPQRRRASPVSAAFTARPATLRLSPAEAKKRACGRTRSIRRRRHVCGGGPRN